MSIKNIFKKIKKIPKKVLIIGVIVIALGFILSPKKKIIPPEFVKAQKQDLKDMISASGVVTGKDTANLAFHTSGKLSYINIKSGDAVYAGEVLAGLDMTELEAQLRIAQSNFRDKKAIADKIHDDLKDVGASENYTQRQIRTTAEVAQDNAYDNLLIAQKNLQDGIIYSPIEGTVTTTDHIPGELVSSSDIIAQVVDFSQVIFEADVDEADIPKVKVGQKAEITLNAYGDKIFKGEVSEIVPQAKTTSGGGVVVTVKISFDDTSVEHISGLNGQVNIITRQKDHALSIPLDALSNGNFVFAKTPTGIRRQKIVTGFKTDTDVEIVKGITEGEEVVVNPAESSPSAGTFRNPLLRLFGGGRLTGGRNAAR